MKTCKNCKIAFKPHTDDWWLGPYSQYCSMRCKSERLTTVYNNVHCVNKGIPEETKEWYKEFTSGKYVSLRQFCRENNIVPMTASLRFKKHIPEYQNVKRGLRGVLSNT